MVDDRCGNYDQLLGRSDIVGAALEHLKQHPNAIVAIIFAVLTPLDDQLSALAQDHGYRSQGLPKHGHGYALAIR